MSDKQEPAMEQTDGDELEAEVKEILDTFNEAASDHSPALEWFGMSLDYDTGDQQIVFEAQNYIDSDGLAALRERGRSVEYIEAYEFDGETLVQIQYSVQGAEDAC